MRTLEDALRYFKNRPADEVFAQDMDDLAHDIVATP
jgi:hypothetical protein